MVQRRTLCDLVLLLIRASWGKIKVKMFKLSLFYIHYAPLPKLILWVIDLFKRINIYRLDRFVCIIKAWKTHITFHVYNYLWSPHIYSRGELITLHNYDLSELITPHNYNLSELITPQMSFKEHCTFFKLFFISPSKLIVCRSDQFKDQIQISS